MRIPAGDLVNELACEFGHLKNQTKPNQTKTPIPCGLAGAGTSERRPLDAGGAGSWERLERGFLRWRWAQTLGGGEAVGGTDPPPPRVRSRRATRLARGAPSSSLAGLALYISRSRSTSTSSRRCCGWRGGGAGAEQSGRPGRLLLASAPLPRNLPCPTAGRLLHVARGFSTGELGQLHRAAMELSREGAGTAKAPKHLWRQPRTHIRIQQRIHSDTERYLRPAAASEGALRPGLHYPRMSWPSSLHRR